MISFRVTAIGPIPHPALAKVSAGRAENDRSRLVHFAGTGNIETRLIRRPSMPVGESIPGPAIIEEAGSTTLVEPGLTVSRTEEDVLIVEVG
jgi:N-methylhydantoinase A/oxoprolinase/acetone carboxylase beta subunit